jgi:pilus assembly protein Flp/PilA
MRDFVIRFLKAPSGATAIEYGLIAALVAAALVGGLTAIGGKLIATFNTIGGYFP